MVGSFKDLFSRQSSDYSKFRPKYPASLFKYLSSLVDQKQLAWDVGTGNGQAAVALAPFFRKVVATDPSVKQIVKAEPHPKVEYRVGEAEHSDFSDMSVDLITVAQAFHWFHQQPFFAEVDRVLRPGGVLAIWCYGLMKITPAIDAVVLKLYNDVLGTYWESERRLVEDGYKSVEMPFGELAVPDFNMTTSWSLDHLIGYLGTWSALQSYIHKNSSNPLEALYQDFQDAWGSEKERPVHWQLSIRASQKPG